MSFEFLLERSPSDNRDIDNIINNSKLTWTAKCSLLKTAFIDWDLVKYVKNKAYSKTIQNLNPSLDDFWMNLLLPDEKIIPSLPLGSCLIKFNLELTAPFFSRDDRSFYPNDNPLKREWVFESPYLGAAGVKGLLRWAWRMCWGDDKFDEETRLFGHRKKREDKNQSKQSQDNAAASSEAVQDDEEENAYRRGWLTTYPLFWKGQVGLDIINPHDRKTGAGNIPIKYEVVKSGGVADCWIAIINRDENIEKLRNALELLKEPIQFLFSHTGLSAKRSVGWGTVDIKACLAWANIEVPPDSPKEPPEPKNDVFDGLVDEDGNLKPFGNPPFTTDILAELSGQSKSFVRKNDENKEAAYKMIVEKFNALNPDKMVEKRETQDFERLSVQGDSPADLIDGILEKTAGVELRNKEV